MTIRFSCLSACDARAAALVAAWATPDDRNHVRGRAADSARDALAARAALRALLAHETSGGAWRLSPDAAGKPFAWAANGQPGPAVSLSHSAGVVAVAIGAVGLALGIDVERHAPRDFAALAAYGYGPAERATVAVAGADAFYRIWTAREALAKATGAGFAGVLGTGDRVGPGFDCGIWQHQCFHFRHQRPFPGYSLAIVTDSPLPRTSEIELY